MYYYHIAVSIKTLARACVYVRACVRVYVRFSFHLFFFAHSYPPQKEGAKPASGPGQKWKEKLKGRTAMEINDLLSEIRIHGRQIIVSRVCDVCHVTNHHLKG